MRRLASGGLILGFLVVIVGVVIAAGRWAQSLLIAAGVAPDVAAFAAVIVPLFLIVAYMLGED